MLRLVRDITLTRRTPSGSADAYGNLSLGTVETFNLKGELQLMSSIENQNDRDTVASDWMLLLPAGTPTGRFDLATIDGQSYEVIGQPERIVNPWTGATSHVEARVRSTQG